MNKNEINDAAIALRKEKERACMAAYRAANPEKVRASKAKYYAANRGLKSNGTKVSLASIISIFVLNGAYFLYF